MPTAEPGRNAENPGPARGSERPENPDEHPTLREAPDPGAGIGPGRTGMPPEYPTLQEVPAPQTPPRAALERADPVSVGAGLVFFLIGGAYLLASGGHLTVNAGWTLSLLFLGLGLSGVVGTIVRVRRGRRSSGRGGGPSGF